MRSWQLARLVGLVLVGLWLAVLSPWGPLRERSGRPEPSDPASAPTSAPAPRPRGSWTIFRGSQRLTGVAPGKLADRLRLLWRFKTEYEVKSSAVVFGGRVFVGSNDGHVYALDQATGTRLWAHKTEDAVEAAPLVLEGKVFVGSVDGSLYVLDAARGHLLWKHPTDAEIIGSANWFRGGDGKARVLVGSHDNKLYCLDLAGGEPLWTYEADDYINGSPAVEQGNGTAGTTRPGGDAKVVFGGCDAMLHVVAADGAKLRRIDVGSYVPGSAALVGGRAFVGNQEGKLLCVDIDTGEILWTYEQVDQEQETDQPFVCSPAVGPTQVLIGSGQGLHCIDRKTGRRIWTLPTRGAVDSSPVICGQKVVFGCGDGKLYVVRLADGKEVWSFEVGEGITSSPAVAGGMIVVGGLDGWVYAFGP